VAIFTGKIICGHCKKSFKRKSERGKYKWVCSGYNDETTCERNIVDEEGLIEFIGRRLFVQERKLEILIPFINESVIQILINETRDFEVHFHDQEPMYTKNRHIHY
jgi:hypothetical protein